jgi:methyl-accepting chemotaxis protein
MNFMRSKAETQKTRISIADLGFHGVKEDCAALVAAMTELAQGDLTAHMTVQSQPADSARHPQIRELVDAFNSVVESLQETAREFNAVTEAPCLRLCYVGADSFLEGRACGEAMGAALESGGQVAVITSSYAASGPELRRKGFLSVVRERFPQISIVESVEGTENPEKAHACAKSLLQRYPALRGIYVTIGATPHDIAMAVLETGKSGQVKVVCHDLVDDTMRDIQAGHITATLGQDPFAQGHEPIIHLYNHLAAGWQPPVPRLLTNLDVVTRENYQHFWSPECGTIESEAVAQRRSRPADKRPNRPLRIAAVGREDSKFWNQVRDGVMAAADKLRACNTTVDWIVPPENRQDGNISPAVYGPLIESLVQQRYDALATGIFHKDYIPYINRTVEAHVPVITFNSEPTSLRGLVFSITEQARKLMGLSNNIAATVSQVNQATAQINNAMNQVSQGTISQNEQVGRTYESMGSLLRNIDEVSTEARQGSEAAEGAAKAAHAGTEAVEKTLASMQSIKESVSETARTVEKLGQHSEKIDIIIKLIHGIAYQIKLLGINAAIEAAHAGQYGAGFSVVAGEIRSLAERTAEATREITDLVASIKSGIDEVEKVMGGGLEKASHGADLAEQAGEVLNEIRHTVEGNKSRLRKIAAAMMEMQAYSHEVGQVMESVATVSEENAAAIEEVTASTREMTSQLKQVNDLTESLTSMAEAEQQLLAKFNLKDENRWAT